MLHHPNCILRFIASWLVGSEALSSIIFTMLLCRCVYALIFPFVLNEGIISLMVPTYQQTIFDK